MSDFFSVVRRSDFDEFHKIPPSTYGGFGEEVGGGLEATYWVE